MMSEEERRKVFWLLKKYSSYTAWNALAQAYFKFADAYLEAIRLSNQSEWDEDDEASASGDAKEILDGRIRFEKGLPLLKKGDRSVWHETSRGYLCAALSPVVFINQIMNPVEFPYDWMKNKDDVVEKHKKLNEYFSRLGAVVEREKPTDSAALGQQNAFKPYFGPFNFPPTLPEVPALFRTTVESGSDVPFNGIYEPEWGAAPAAQDGLFNKLKFALSSPPSLMESSRNTDSIERRANIGCMNYLLAGTAAPQYQDGERDKPMPVTWRLVWKDERYVDGTIPEEEKDYLAVRDATQSSVNPEAISIRVEAGKSCPQTGYYFTPAQSNSRCLFKQDDIMPSVGGDYGETIWQWDEQQS